VVTDRHQQAPADLGIEHLRVGDRLRVVEHRRPPRDVGVPQQRVRGTGPYRFSVAEVCEPLRAGDRVQLVRGVVEQVDRDARHLQHRASRIDDQLRGTVVVLHAEQSLRRLVERLQREFALLLLCDVLYRAAYADGLVALVDGFADRAHPAGRLPVRLEPHLHVVALAYLDSPLEVSLDLRAVVGVVELDRSVHVDLGVGREPVESIELV